MSRYTPEIQAALDTLREAGWNVEQSVGYGFVTAGLLCPTYGNPPGKRYVASWAREPWQEEPDDTPDSAPTAVVADRL